MLQSLNGGSSQVTEPPFGSPSPEGWSCLALRLLKSVSADSVLFVLRHACATCSCLTAWTC